MERFAFRVFAAFSAGLALVAYILGIIQLSSWVWAQVLLAEENKWYGTQEIPVLREFLAVVFAFTVFFGGVYVFLILPAFVFSLIHEGFKRYIPKHHK